MFLEQAFANKIEPNDKIEEITRDLYKGLDWFKQYNAKAYMILLLRRYLFILLKSIVIQIIVFRINNVSVQSKRTSQAF